MTGPSIHPVDRMVQSLQGTTLFQNLTAEEVKYLLRRCHRHQVPMNTSVIEENDFGDSLFYIMNGEVFLTRRIGEEEEFLGTLTGGDSFGETALLMGGVRTASIRTKTHCLLLELGRETVESLSPGLSAKLMRNIAVCTNEKLSIANYLINRLYEQLRALAPEQPDWEESEEEFIKDFEDGPQV